MVEIVEVRTKKQRKDFLNLPFKLYKGNKYFVPPLRIDEKTIFNEDYVYNEVCDVVFFNAYREGKIVGRISGIIQRAANEKWGQKRVRFTRFDAIDDREVSDALFDAVCAWAKARGMTEIVGPLGYSDLEREGLLIKGFDELSTFEEQYNHAYYQALVEGYGFEKEVDWLEHKLYLPKQKDERLLRVCDALLKKFHLRYVKITDMNDYIAHYADQFFEMIDTTYAKLYGTVPFTKKMMETMIGGFKLLLRPDDIATIVDENDRMVAFAIAFPSIAEIVNKSKGRITLPFLIRLLKVKKHPKVIDFGLIGVLPEYESKGVATAMIAFLIELMEKNPGLDHLETNLVLEDNYHSNNLQKHFDRVEHKRRRCYKKEIV